MTEFGMPTLVELPSPEERMLAADLVFETAAKLRDQMLALRGEKTMATGEKSYRGRRRRR